jgi:transposase
MWSRLESLLPKPKGRHGKDDRLFMQAICWMLCTGAAWRDLPLDYGNWKRVYHRYNNWSKKGYITAILADKTYDIDSFRQALTENGTNAVSPSTQ